MAHEFPPDALPNAEAAVAYAQQVRRFHRRRTGRASQQREADIKLAMERLREAMKPLRSARGRFSYDPQTSIVLERQNAIIEMSEAVQRERRKLWKMKTPEQKDRT